MDILVKALKYALGEGWDANVPDSPRNNLVGTGESSQLDDETASTAAPEGEPQQLAGARDIDIVEAGAMDEDDYHEQANLAAQVSLFNLQRQVQCAAGDGDDEEAKKNPESTNNYIHVLSDDDCMPAGPILEEGIKVLRRIYPSRQEFLSRPWSEDDCVELTKHLRMFRFETTHRPEYRRRYTVSTIGPGTSHSILLNIGNAKKSVREYFAERYNVELKYPHLPTVVVKKASGPTYLPIEICELLPGQPLYTRDYEERDEATLQALTLQAQSSHAADPSTKKKSSKRKKKSTAPAEQQAHRAVNQQSADGGANLKDYDCHPPTQDIPGDIQAPDQEHASEVLAEQPEKKEKPLWYERRQHRLPGWKTFSISRDEWERRRDFGVCLRCGHPSHGIKDCVLYGDHDGSKTWESVPEYANMNVTIPEHPRRFGIPKEEWERRRREHLCCRCGHYSHSLQDCLLRLSGDHDPNKTWMDVPEYMETEQQHQPETEVSPAPMLYDPSFDYGQDELGFVFLTKDKKVKKKVIKEGDGAYPNHEWKVEVHYTGYLHQTANEIFDCSHDRGSPLTITLGVDEVIPAWEIALAAMKVGEEAIMICDPEYAYGEAGYPPRVPPNAVLRFEISFLRAVEPLAPLHERILDAKECRKSGNAHFTGHSPEYTNAIADYRRGLTLLTECWGATLSEESEIDELRTALWSNLAAAYLKIQDYAGAKEACTAGLEGTPFHPKMLFRLGQALTGLGDFAGATRTFASAAEHDPSNSSAIANEIVKVTRLADAKKRAEKKLYARMFNGN